MKYAPQSMDEELNPCFVKAMLEVTQKGEVRQTAGNYRMVLLHAFQISWEYFSLSNTLQNLKRLYLVVFLLTYEYDLGYLCFHYFDTFSFA